MSCRINSALSNKLANAGFVSACLVVCMHVYPKLEEGSFDWWIHRFFSGNGVASVAVPMFFCISGFLFAGRMRESGWWLRQVKTRVRSLLVPYLFWNFFHWGLMLSLAWIALMVGSEFGGADLQDITLKRLALVLGFNPIKFPEYSFLWFLRCLFVLALISPLFNVLCNEKKLWGGGRFVAFMIKLLVPCFLPQFDSWIPGFNINGWLVGLFWFSLGIFLRYHPVVLSQSCKRIILYWCAALWLVFFAFQWKCLIDVFHLLGCAIFWLVISDRCWPKKLTSLAFPIFIVHGFVLIFLPIAVKQWPVLGCSLGGYFLQVLFILAACGLSISVFRRMLPRLYSITFGGRGCDE